MPDGDMRRPPLLWEQRLAKRVNSLGPGVVTSSGANVVEDFGASTGYNEPDDTITTLGTPSTPTVTGTLKGVAVGWDGDDTDGDPYNAENQWVEVHVGGTAGFTPGTATKRGVLYESGTWVVTPLTAGSTYYAQLVGYDSEGNASEASAEASGTPGLVIASDIGTGAVGTAAVSFSAREVGGITQTVGTAEPTGALEGDTWIDTTDGSYNYYNGSSWVTQSWGSASISAGAVTALQIAAGAVIADKIGAGAVTTAKLNAGAVTAEKIAASTITADKLAVSFLTATDVGSGGSTTIDGGRITTGSVSGNRITGGTITGTTFVTRGSGYRARLKDGGATGVDHLEFLNGTTTLAKLGATTLEFQLQVPQDMTIYNVSGGLGNLTVGDIGCDEVDTSVLYAGEISSQIAFRVGSGGDVYSNGIDGNTTANAANVRCGASAQLLKSTSTVRVKTDLQPVYGVLAGIDAAKISPEAASVGWFDVLDVCPTEFQSLAAADAGERVFGFIAEDVADKFPWAAEWDDDGIPSSVQDRPILAALLAVVKDQAATITDLTARIEALEG